MAFFAIVLISALYFVRKEMGQDGCYESSKQIVGD